MRASAVFSVLAIMALASARDLTAGEWHEKLRRGAREVSEGIVSDPSSVVGGRITDQTDPIVRARGNEVEVTQSYTAHVGPVRMRTSHVTTLRPDGSSTHHVSYSNDLGGSGQDIIEVRPDGQRADVRGRSSIRTPLGGGCAGKFVGRQMEDYHDERVRKNLKKNY